MGSSTYTSIIGGGFSSRLTVDATAEAHHPTPLVAYVQQRHSITRKPPLGLGQAARHRHNPRSVTTPHSKAHRPRYLYFLGEGRQRPPSRPPKPNHLPE
ncbi:hypothetical protein CSPAE12_07679 [Colletotrichum incanum]|nr:hypothetical protein CSPAE12_07679 [Colletotrichum incanum]